MFFLFYFSGKNTKKDKQVDLKVDPFIIRSGWVVNFNPFKLTGQVGSRGSQPANPPTQPDLDPTRPIASPSCTAMDAVILKHVIISGS